MNYLRSINPYSLQEIAQYPVLTAEELEEVGRPTLIGSDRLLRIDTSRLPRIDQYNPLVVRRPTDQQLPSDVKTVTYFFSESSPATSDPLMPDLGHNGGLYRRQIDRAVEAFTGEESISDKPDEFCELVAPEVLSIQFQYFDGEDWQSEWDSEAENGFPVAIEVLVTMDPLRGMDPRQTQAASGAEDLEVLRTVVNMPVAEILPEEEEQQVSDQPGGESGR